MKVLSPVIVDGESLTIENFVRVALFGNPIYLTEDAKILADLRASRDFYWECVKKGLYAYGGGTGVGSNVVHIIPLEDRIEFQARLIDSLYCGVGEELAKKIIRGSILLRTNALVKKACSAIGTDKIYKCIELLNRDIAPIMYEDGSVGASGDLVPLSSIAEAIQGKGKARYKGRVWITAELFAELGGAPLTLEEKEGLSLVNGTSVMTALAAFALYEAYYLTDLSLACAGMAGEALLGMTDPLHPFVHEVKNHPGQRQAASFLRELLRGSHLTRDLENLRTQVIESVGDSNHTVKTPIELQDPYSVLRCVPQLFGPTLEILELVERWIVNEMNSANDNPIVNLLERKIHHTGNFSGFYIALGMDILKLAIFNIADLMHALQERMLNNKCNRGLPPSLAGEDPGFNSGFKGVGLCGSDIFGKVCFLSNPYSIHRRSAEIGNQEVVSFGFGAAEYALEQIKKYQEQVAEVLIHAVQALDLRTGRDTTQLAPKTIEFYQQVRKKVAFLGADRPMHDDIVKVVRMIKNHKFQLDSVKA